MAAGLGFNLDTVRAETVSLRIANAKETTSICCFCSGGCGLICHTVDGKLINVEGDPDNPVNRGSNCAKGASCIQTSVNNQRITKLMYRAPGSDKWEEKPWDWAVNRVAELTKKTRDASIVHKNDKDVVVNRTEAIASLGSSILNNEDLYLIAKLMRGLGVVNIEHQARI